MRAIFSTVLAVLVVLFASVVQQAVAKDEVLTWDAPAGATQFIVKVSLDGGTSWTPLPAATSPSVTVTVPDWPDTTAHEYKMCHTVDGIEVCRDEWSFKFIAVPPIPPPPTNVTVVD